MRSCFINPGRDVEAAAGRAECIYTVKRFDTLVRQVKKVLVDVLGISVCGFMTQAVDLQWLCAMNGENVCKNLPFRLRVLRNNTNKSPKPLRIREQGF